eukprot:3756242-Amphidinium_carterae.3
MAVPCSQCIGGITLMQYVSEGSQNLRIKAVPLDYGECALDEVAAVGAITAEGAYHLELAMVQDASLRPAPVRSAKRRRLSVKWSGKSEGAKDPMGDDGPLLGIAGTRLTGTISSDAKAAIRSYNRACWPLLELIGGQNPATSSAERNRVKKLAHYLLSRHDGLVTLCPDFRSWSVSQNREVWDEGHRLLLDTLSAIYDKAVSFGPVEKLNYTDGHIQGLLLAGDTLLHYAAIVLASSRLVPHVLRRPALIAEANIDDASTIIDPAEGVVPLFAGKSVALATEELLSTEVDWSKTLVHTRGSNYIGEVFIEGQSVPTAMRLMSSVSVNVNRDGPTAWFGTCALLGLSTAYRSSGLSGFESGILALASFLLAAGVLVSESTHRSRVSLEGKLMNLLKRSLLPSPSGPGLVMPSLYGLTSNDSSVDQWVVLEIVEEIDLLACWTHGLLYRSESDSLPESASVEEFVKLGSKLLGVQCDLPSEYTGALPAMERIRKKQSFTSSTTNQQLSSCLSRFLTSLPSDDFGIAMVAGSELIRPDIDFEAKMGSWRALRCLLSADEFKFARARAIRLGRSILQELITTIPRSTEGERRMLALELKTDLLPEACLEERVTSFWPVLAWRRRKLGAFGSRLSNLGMPGATSLLSIHPADATLTEVLGQDAFIRPMYAGRGLLLETIVTGGGLPIEEVTVDKKATYAAQPIPQGSFVARCSELQKIGSDIAGTMSMLGPGRLRSSGNVLGIVTTGAASLRGRSALSALRSLHLASTYVPVGSHTLGFRELINANNKLGQSLSRSSPRPLKAVISSFQDLVAVDPGLLRLDASVSLDVARAMRDYGSPLQGSILRVAEDLSSMISFECTYSNSCRSWIMGLRAESVLRHVERLQLIDDSIVRNLAHLLVSIPQSHMGSADLAVLPAVGSEETLQMAGLLTASTELGFDWERAIRVSGLESAMCFLVPELMDDMPEKIDKRLYINGVEAVLLACWSDIKFARSGTRPVEAEELSLVRPLFASIRPRIQEANMCARLVLNLLGQRLLATAREPKLSTYFVQHPVAQVRADRIERMRDTDRHHCIPYDRKWFVGKLFTSAQTSKSVLHLAALDLLRFAIQQAISELAPLSAMAWGSEWSSTVGSWNQALEARIEAHRRVADNEMDTEMTFRPAALMLLESRFSMRNPNGEVLSSSIGFVRATMADELAARTQMSPGDDRNFQLDRQ